MATNTITKIALAVVLDDGTDSQGNQMTVNESFPTLNRTNYDDDKALTIIGALEPCLSKSVTNIRKTTTASVSAS